MTGFTLKLASPAFRLVMVWEESISVCHIETHLKSSLTTLRWYGWRLYRFKYCAHILLIANTELRSTKPKMPISSKCSLMYSYQYVLTRALVPLDSLCLPQMKIAGQSSKYRRILLGLGVHHEAHCVAFTITCLRVSLNDVRGMLCEAKAKVHSPP